MRLEVILSYRQFFMRGKPVTGDKRTVMGKKDRHGQKRTVKRHGLYPDACIDLTQPDNEASFNTTATVL